MTPLIVACFAVDRHGILWEDRGSREEGPVVLAAVEAVTEADPVRASRPYDPDASAEAATAELLKVGVQWTESCFLGPQVGCEFLSMVDMAGF